MIYIILLFVALFLFWNVKKRNIQIWYSAFLLVFMMLLVGMRDETIGVDSPQYVMRFSYIYDIKDIIYEPLYQLSVNFVNIFTDKYGWWFLLLSFITFVSIGLVICKYSKLPLLSVIVYMASTIHLFPETMNVMRQSVAIAFLLVSYFEYINRQKIVAFLLFFCAVGFHFSSIIVFPFYFLNSYNFSKRIVVFTLIITFFFGFVSPNFISVDLITNIFSNAEGMVELGLDRFSGYRDKTGLNALGLISAMFPLNVLCFLLIPSENDDKSYKYLFNFFFAGVIISNLIYCAVPFGFRYSYPFFIVESVLFANKYYKEKRLKYYFVFFVLYYLLYLYSLSISEKPNMIIPYKLNVIFDFI